MLYDFPHGYAGLVISLAAGFFGSSFFMLSELQNRVSEGNLDDIGQMWSPRMVSLRCLVGVGGSLILYFFFQSGLLEGSIWPRLTKLGFEGVVGGGTLVVPNRDLSLLAVWSFLAGYSQTLVPSILIKTQARTNAQT